MYVHIEYDSREWSLQLTFETQTKARNCEANIVLPGLCYGQVYHFFMTHNFRWIFLEIIAPIKCVWWH